MARGPIERLLVPSACPLACTASFIVLDRLTLRFNGGAERRPLEPVVMRRLDTLLRLGLEDEVEGRFGRAPEVFEATAGDYLPHPRLAGLRA